MHAKEYAAEKEPRFVQTTRAQYLMLDGCGAPGSAVFATAIATLYSVAFTTKMAHKAGGRHDYAVGKLEALWWTKSNRGASMPRSQWQWRLLIRTPAFVTKDEVKKAIVVLMQRKKDAGVKDVHLDMLEEGECVQAQHVGPYDRESQTFAAMESFARSQGRTFCGAHHEIYLSDPRRVDPARLKTILRHPVQPEQ